MTGKSGSIQPGADSQRVQARKFAESCLALRVRRLNRIMTRVYTAALRPLGLTHAQLSLLVAIELTAPAAASRIARLLDLEKSTLSRNLARMAARGWIVADPGLQLTARGRSLLAEAAPRWSAAQKKMRRVLGGGAARTLDGLIARAQAAWPD